MTDGTPGWPLPRCGDARSCRVHAFTPGTRGHQGFVISPTPERARLKGRRMRLLSTRPLSCSQSPAKRRCRHASNGAVSPICANLPGARKSDNRRSVAFVPTVLIRLQRSRPARGCATHQPRRSTSGRWRAGKPSSPVRSGTWPTRRFAASAPTAPARWNRGGPRGERPGGEGRPPRRRGDDLVHAGGRARLRSSSRCRKK